MAVRVPVVTTVAIAILALLAGGAGPTDAAFSSQTENSGSVFVAAASFCGEQTATASADTYLDQQSPGSNYGSATDLYVRRHPNRNQRSLLRFPLPPIPDGCGVVGATLRLYAADAQAGQTLQAWAAASAWGEATATWGNQPGTTGSAATAPSGAGWVSFTVTAQVQGMYAGANHGFLVRDSTEGSSPVRTQTFSSREGTTPPELVVTFG